MRIVPRLLALTVVVSGPFARADAPQTRTYMVPMRDGVRLATDVHFPGGATRKHPVILIRTPYGRTRYREEYGSWTRWGYAVAVQDLRGRFDSEGDSIPFLSDGWGELCDGYDTVEWLAQQEFSNGRVGTTGASAMGITQALVAPAAPPSLACQYIQVAATSGYHHASYPGGVLRKHQVERWLEGNRFAQEALERVLQEPFYGGMWLQLDASRVASRVTVPAVHYGGWYDTFSEGTIAGFLSRQIRGGPGARGTQKLVMGPWTHGGEGKRDFGEFELPEEARFVPPGYGARRWFEHHLRGIPRGVDRLPPAVYYVMGPLDGNERAGDFWRTSDSWPPASTPLALYLASGGALREGAARPEDGADTLRFDPQDPVPTVGGRNLVLQAGPMDQRPIESRSDVLVYTTDAVKREVEIAGRVTARVVVTADWDDPHLAARLCDVYPDGRSIVVANGIRRVVTRDGYARPRPIRSGTPVEVEVDLWSTSVVFAEGHRIRLDLSASDFPRAALPSDAGVSRPRNVEVHHGRGHPSRVVLPVTRRGDALDHLRYNEVRFKAAHNSVDRTESLAEQLDRDPDAPQQGGCRGLELDIVVDPHRAAADRAWSFAVQHGGAYREESPRLRDLLSEIRGWSEAHPGHHVLTIHIDVKAEAALGDDRVFARELDRVLAAGLGRHRIYRPAQLQRNAPTLLEGARRHGWPTLAALRERMVVCLSGSDLEEAVARRRRAYAALDPEIRLAFVDIDQRALPGDERSDGVRGELSSIGDDRVFLNLQLGRGNWVQLAHEARRLGLMTRVWKANDASSWGRAVGAGVHVLSTDRIRGHDWARVGGLPYERIDVPASAGGPRG